MHKQPWQNLVPSHLHGAGALGKKEVEVGEEADGGHLGRQCPGYPGTRQGGPG